MISAYFNNLLTSFSYLVLMKNRIYGLLLLGLSFVNPSSGALAIIAYVSLIIFGKLIGMSREQLVNSMFSYNSLLVGLSMGFMFELSLLSIVFTVIASFFTLLLSFSLQTFFSYYLRVPILNLPFTITATLVYLSSIRYGNLYVINQSHLTVLNVESFPLWLSGLLKATGDILFLPYDLFGIIILLTMLVFSRINFFLMITGYYAGTLFLAILKGSSYVAFTDIYSFNFILIALALGGLFLIPSVKSYCIAFAGVLISVFVLDAMNILWASYGIPAFTFPFAIVVPLMLYVLTISKFRFVTTTYLQSPEQNLEHYVNYYTRFNTVLPQPQLPFSGEWSVYQPFNGEWTHKGIWSYAVDFNIQDRSTGLSFRTDGKRVEDYYCYGKPVVSPVSGRIVEVIDDCEDNPPGVIDDQNNWGNFVIIFSDWGYYAELSHFVRGSIIVRPGEYVVQGQLIGKCGNSGYSPEPHIHLQCQYLAHIGAPTVPFTFSNCILNECCMFGNVLELKKGQTVRSVTRSKAMERKVRFILGDNLSFSVSRNGASPVTMNFTVRMADDGSYYLDDLERAGARLFFSNRDGVFCFYRHEGPAYSPLRFIFLALPRMPLTDENIWWQDDVNYLLANPGGMLFTFLKSFNQRLCKAGGIYKMKDGAVEGKITVSQHRKRISIDTRVEFDPVKGFSRIEVKTPRMQYVLTRK